MVTYLHVANYFLLHTLQHFPLQEAAFGSVAKNDPAQSLIRIFAWQYISDSVQTSATENRT